MNLIHICKETLMMMGFTFAVGIAFAYLLKLMILLFSCFGKNGMTVWMKKSRVWGRAYRMGVEHIYREARYITLPDEGRTPAASLMLGTYAGKTRAIDGLAEYHFGDPEESALQDKEMKRLYEFHYGKI